ncbi:1-deoxy-D-xylulose-5-phosphate reductoisomerase [Labrys okinawensis]|uniref:1-deoxy-D-xylulose 5-phosphate reductoisomerase n=1 Tax=Labrys okinawensis TaxID=346911 RepID=A0A2S9Q5X2_9HYPH|nr:1-deoxy-D-xylulose-5-phosphate reductoisomerase [Labrys okinawensis]PRH84768.1 1-deoxy-D-xylulose-5-phosphate reductoisomerase [Labrys okinawensis]
MPAQRIAILGATGSIGASTLDIVARHPERFSVFALTAHNNLERLFAQCVAFRPEVVVVADGQRASRMQARLRDAGLPIRVSHGPTALCEVARDAACDTVVAAIVGAAGLKPTLAAARAGKKILFANKEALVMSGALLMQTAARAGARLLPVDSEHNAIFQCYPEQARLRGGAIRLILTASGGPFLNRPLETFDTITPDEACAHPRWSMGRKISVDSATMMNKGLEVIEAHWLFAMPAERIDVVMHPQSIVHSMVAYADQSVLAQMGNPDMRIPIAHALAYPERIDSGVAPLDLTISGGLTFMPPDLARFPCLKLVLEVVRGGRGAVALNAANEVAVAAFLNGRLGFRGIPEVVEAVLERLPEPEFSDLDHILEADRRARKAAEEAVEGHPPRRAA